jgi:hypothetical protein
VVYDGYSVVILYEFRVIKVSERLRRDVIRDNYCVDVTDVCAYAFI